MKPSPFPTPTKELAMNAVTPKAPATGFTIRNVSVLAYACGFTLWHYRAGTTPLATMMAPGFFDAAADMFALGDMMMVSGAFGGTVLCVVATGQRVVVTPMCGAETVPMLAAAE